MKQIHWIALGGSLLAAASGCTADAPPVVHTAANAKLTVTTTAKAKPALPVVAKALPPSAIVVSKEIARQCQLPTAQFEFDSSDLGPSAAPGLEALALCFTTGALQGSALKIIGHADSRGDELYNFGLGQRRASSVAEYLSKSGLPGSQMETSSMGELDAYGSDPEGWARDRRVEILLADEKRSSR